jgi:hypothetical protein
MADVGSERLPAIDFAHVDLAGCQKHREQYAAISAGGHCVLTWRAELRAQSLDCIRRFHDSPSPRGDSNDGPGALKHAVVPLEPNLLFYAKAGLSHSSPRVIFAER